MVVEAVIGGSEPAESYRCRCPTCLPAYLLHAALSLTPCTHVSLQVFDQVVVQPRDAREASDVFYRQVRWGLGGLGRGQRGCSSHRLSCRYRSAPPMQQPPRHLALLPPRLTATTNNNDPATLPCLPRLSQGMGDVLLTYENEAFFTNLVVPPKDRLPYIVPDNNIRVCCAAGGVECGGCGVLGWQRIQLSGKAAHRRGCAGWAASSCCLSCLQLLGLLLL